MEDLRSVATAYCEQNIRSLFISKAFQHFMEHGFEVTKDLFSSLFIHLFRLKRNRPLTEGRQENRFSKDAGKPKDLRSRTRDKAAH